MFVLPYTDGPVVLDLVAHFLGVASHDNVNAAPSGYTAVRGLVSDPMAVNACGPLLVEIPHLRPAACASQRPAFADASRDATTIPWPLKTP